MNHKGPLMYPSNGMEGGGGGGGRRAYYQPPRQTMPVKEESVIAVLRQRCRSASQVNLALVGVLVALVLSLSASFFGAAASDGTGKVASVLFLTGIGLGLYWLAVCPKRLGAYFVAGPMIAVPALLAAIMTSTAAGIILACALTFFSMLALLLIYIAHH